MNRLEYLLASALLRVVGAICDRLPKAPRRIVLATARVATLEGNLAFIHAAIRAHDPQREIVLLLEPYSYGLRGKLAYLGRLIRGTYHLRTAGLFVVDNAYLPIHVAAHGHGTTVVQVWHAVGSLKRFGAGMRTPLDEPERTFLHRHYDYVVASSESAREPYATALRTPLERILPLGAPRTDLFFDETALAAARERILLRHPELAGRTVVTYAPTFRGRGRDKSAPSGLDAARLRAALPDTHALVLKTHPNLDPATTPRAGYDVIADPTSEMNEWLASTDILITDYSSSIFEFATLRRPMVLLVPDLDDYERDPGFYLDMRTEMVGTQVVDTDGVIEVIMRGRFDLTGYDAFVARHVGATDGRSSARFVARFVAEGSAERGDTLRRDVRHD